MRVTFTSDPHKTLPRYRRSVEDKDDPLHVGVLVHLNYGGITYNIIKSLSPSYSSKDKRYKTVVCLLHSSSCRLLKFLKSRTCVPLGFRRRPAPTRGDFRPTVRDEGSCRTSLSSRFLSLFYPGVSDLSVLSTLLTSEPSLLPRVLECRPSLEPLVDRI